MSGAAVQAVSPTVRAPQWQSNYLGPRQELQGLGAWSQQNSTLFVVSLYRAHWK